MPLNRSAVARRREQLTPRELGILVLLAAGRSPDEIAARFAISVQSAGSEVSRIYRKTGADRRQCAAREELRRRSER